MTLTKSVTLLRSKFPGLTLHEYLSKILARSCQDLGKILAKIVTRYCQELQDVVVRSYQDSHVPKKNFIVKSYLPKQIWNEVNENQHLCRFTLLVRHVNFLFAMYKT